MNTLINWFFSAIAIMISAYVLPGVTVDGIIVALVLAIVLGAINGFIKPLLVLLTLPINILTLGLFSLVINAVLVLFADFIVPGFAVDGFWWAMLFAVVLAVVSSVFGQLGEKKS